ncbi:hypothetical protein Vafri_20414 [Volvox africanus]|uniref:Uncharacterized protein n=1 Tax=Volvox africanus TaxID=51714 RepID=A0A8J4BRG9_9CHLO|nr:hypothetical protein Vafri_20414 [Volvox africanus]
MLTGTQSKVRPVHGRPRPALSTLILWLVAHSFHNGISALLQHPDEAAAGIPLWLRGLLSPSKAAWPNLDVHDSLSALTMSFPIWLAETFQVDSGFSVADEGGSTAGLGFATPTGGSPLLRELNSLENIRSAQRLEDAVVAFLTDIAVQVEDRRAAGAAEGNSAANDATHGAPGRLLATMLDIRQRLDSELEQLAAVLGEWDPKTGQEAGGGNDVGRSDGGEKRNGKGDNGAAAGNAGRLEAGHVADQTHLGSLQDALGHRLADGLVGWLQHAATHPMQFGSSTGGAGGGGVGVRAAAANSPSPAGAGRRPPEVDAEIGERLLAGNPNAYTYADGRFAAEWNTGDRQGARGMSRAGETAGGERVSVAVGGRRLQQSTDGGSGSNNGGDGGSDGDGGGGGGGGGGSSTWVETNGIQGFDWRNVRPVRDAIADAALNNQKPRTRATERLLQLYHIIQRDILDGNVPFTGGRVQRWCENRPYAFTPRVPNALPEEYVGPSFYITRTTGNCVLRPDISALGINTWTQLYERMACLSPSLQYLLLPAVYSGAADQPESFQCPQCVPVQRFGRALDISFFPMEPRTIKFPDKRAFLAAMKSNMTTLVLTRAAARQASAWMLRNLRRHLKGLRRSAVVAGVVQQAEVGEFVRAAAELLAAVVHPVRHGGGMLGWRDGDRVMELVKELLRPGPRDRHAGRVLEYMEAVPFAAWRLPPAAAGPLAEAEALAQAVRRHARKHHREVERLLRLLP